MKGRQAAYMASYRRLLQEFEADEASNAPKFSEQCPMKAWLGWLSTGANAADALKEFTLERQQDPCIKVFFKIQTQT